MRALVFLFFERSDWAMSSSFNNAYYFFMLAYFWLNNNKSTLDVLYKLDNLGNKKTWRILKFLTSKSIHLSHFTYLLSFSQQIAELGSTVRPSIPQPNDFISLLPLSSHANPLHIIENSKVGVPFPRVVEPRCRVKKLLICVLSTGLVTLGESGLVCVLYHF